MNLFSALLNEMMCISLERSRKKIYWKGCKNRIFRITPTVRK
ncbi:hypothetical protein Zm00014a_005783 [Zea mays]|uniref:Uncharacterized protein n=1 Tax=Zea mays TaxID=4577 RepID=A0A3L6ECZ8_MAIZE|nr:hypothetical protein Zm00014a_005783 [Zea mays]